MKLLLSTYARLLICLFLCYETLGLNQSDTTPLQHIEKVYDCSSANNGICCGEGDFQCQDGSCIPFINVCDANISLPFAHKKYCRDFSDEKGCSNENCSTRSPTCQQGCTDLSSNRSRCHCSEGYTHKENSEHICVDVDECKLDLHVCSQICQNTEGSYECSCHKGFHLDNSRSHRGRCIPKEENVLILFNSNRWIYAYDLKRRKTREFVPAGKVSTMDYDPETDMIYWWNEHMKTLSRSYLPLKETGVTVGHEQTLCTSSQDMLIRRKALAVDWAIGNLYWVFNHKSNNDELKSSIALTTLKGNPMKTLFYRTNVTITSMVLDPPQARIYWVVSGRHANKIEFSSMHEKNMQVKTFVNIKEQHAIALTLDQGNGRLYWFDSKSSAIYTAHKEGTEPKKIKIIDVDSAPHSMDVFGDYLYWVTKAQDSAGYGQLIRIDIHGRDEIEILFDNLIGESSLKVYHHNKYKDSKKKNWNNLRRHCLHHCRGSLCIFEGDGFHCSTADSSNTCEVKKKPAHTQIHPGPVKCNCNITSLICRKNGPHHQCHCNLPCQGHNQDSSAFKSIVGYTTVAVSLILICFVLSFYKRSNSVQKTKSIQMQVVN